VFAPEISSDPLDLIREGLAALRAEDRSAWSPEARADRLIELRAIQERLDAEVVRAVAACDAVTAWGEAALGPVSWLAGKTSMPRYAAARLLKTARLVGANDRTAEALAGGEVTVPHVEALAAAAHRRSELYREHEEALLDAASNVEVQDFHTVTRRWALLADDVLSRDDAAFGFVRRGFTLSPTIGGSAVSGFLDPEASATVTAALGAIQPPEGASDTRSLAQRMADGLVLLCQRSMGGKLPESRPIAGVEITVDHGVLAGHALANLDGLRCDIEGFGPIARITAQRLVCDCAVARVVLNARGEILDFGRSAGAASRRPPA
jgi:hypothetical protein